jgi:hypothetical protein
MYTHLYIKRSIRPSQCLHTKNTCIRGPMQHLGTKNGLTSLYTTKKIYTSCTTHGASIAPPPSPPSGGGGPPPPAPGGGGPPTRPSCPGDRRPLVIAARTAARRTMACHGGGTPTHRSRKISSWIRVHMPSGTSCKIVSRRRRISSESTPVAARGACDGPAPGSSYRCLLAARSGSAGRPAASSR